MLAAAKYDVLDLKYSDSNPAVLLHVDGSGFAYYESGRKAICISSHGADGKGNARRFGAIIHQDRARGDIAGVLDEWGCGHVEGQLNPGDMQAPCVIISGRGLTVVDGSGTSTEVPHGRSTGGADIALRVNANIAVQHRHGRTSIDFQSGGVSHTFIVGELKGQEVPGMNPAEPRTLGKESMSQIGDVTLKLEAVRDKVKTLKVDPSKGNAKAKAPGVDVSGLAGKKDISDVLATLNALQQSLAHPGLAPANLDWNTEGQLKKLIQHAHPQCPGQDRSWTIARVSGKCTEERLANAKPTVASPKSIPQVSQLKLPDLIEDTAYQLLVVICLASYAQDQSNHARLVAQKAYAELERRGDSNGAVPVKMVSIELAEMSGFAEHYGIKEVPYCLMFWQGNPVVSKRMSGMRVKSRDPGALKPRVLLVEPNPGQQLKLERGLRRSGCPADLALDGAQAMRLASSRSQPYTVLLTSATLPVAQLLAVVDRVKHEMPTAAIIVFDAGHPGPPDDDPEMRTRFISECSHVFPYVPGYTAMEAVLARPEKDTRRVPAARPGTESENFVEEVLSVLERSRRNGTVNGAKSTAVEGGA